MTDKESSNKILDDLFKDLLSKLQSSESGSSKFLPNPPLTPEIIEKVKKRYGWTDADLRRFKRNKILKRIKHIILLTRIRQKLKSIEVQSYIIHIQVRYKYWIWRLFKIHPKLY